MNGPRPAIVESGRGVRWPLSLPPYVVAVLCLITLNFFRLF